MIKPITPEFSHRLPVDRNAPARQSFKISANERERAGLAKRFGLVAIESLTAEGGLETLDDGRRAVLQAHLTARVIQSCVVTLEPVAAVVDERFTVEYDADVDPDADSPQAVPEEIEIFLAEPDPPDPLTDGGVDVGEAVAEHLALSLAPYPRAPGVDFTPPSGFEPDEESPFKALAGLLKKD